eukprot:5162229-Lingulodinium_polyedra.AAC.1
MDAQPPGINTITLHAQIVTENSDRPGWQIDLLQRVERHLGRPTLGLAGGRPLPEQTHVMAERRAQPAS